MELDRADKIGPIEKIRSARRLSGREGVGQVDTWGVGVPPIQAGEWPAYEAHSGSVCGGRMPGGAGG